MKPNHILSSAVLAVIGLLALYALLAAREEPSTAIESGSSVAGGLQPTSGQRVEERASRRPPPGTTEPASPGAADCSLPVLPAFWRYVDSLRAIPDALDRERALLEPAAALRTRSREELDALAMRGLDDVRFETELLPGSGVIQLELVSALLRRWVSCAAERGEDLRGAALQLFSRTASPTLAEADPALLELACSLLRYFHEEEDSLLVAPPLLSALRSVSLDRPFDLDRQGQPVLRVLASIGSWHEWVRPDLLALLEEPWLSPSARASFVMMLTSSGTYAEWAAAVDSLLRSEAPGAKWAAVEALRGFAAPRGGEPRMAPEEVLAALPPELFQAEETTLRWAVFELTASFGGEPGRERLVALLADPDQPDRSAIVSFLCHKGKLRAADCLALLSEEDAGVRASAIDGLGHLARQDPAQLEHLRERLRGETDPELRCQILKALRVSERDVVADLVAAVEDPDPSVRAEALRQIGFSAEPQAELLAGFATDPELEPALRRRAFQEWLLDAPDADVAAIFERMVADPDPEIRTEGYLWTAAAAIAAGDAQALAEWEALPVPRTLLEQADWLPDGLADSAVGAALSSSFDGTIRGEISARIEAELSALRDPLHLRELELHDLMLSGGGGGVPLLERQHALPKRILQYLGERSR